MRMTSQERATVSELPFVFRDTWSGLPSVQGRFLRAFGPCIGEPLQQQASCSKRSQGGSLRHPSSQPRPPRVLDDHRIVLVRMAQRRFQREVIKVSAPAIDSEAVPPRPGELRRWLFSRGRSLGGWHCRGFVNVQPWKDHNGASTVARVSRTICCPAGLVKPCEESSMISIGLNLPPHHARAHDSGARLTLPEVAEQILLTKPESGRRQMRRVPRRC